MGSSMPAVIDYLESALINGVTTPLNKFGQTVTVPPITTVNPNVEVVDAQPNTSGPWIVIARSDTDASDGGNASADYLSLGAGEVEEAYTLPCFVRVEDYGPAQKPLRDAVFALYDAVVRLVTADLTFGGALKRGRYGRISSYALVQSPADEGADGAQMSAQINFTLQIQNAYVP